MTNFWICFNANFFCFNPHTHEGCDWVLILKLTLTFSFNPHTHEGCDDLSHRHMFTAQVFQSTHPRRVWRSATVGLSAKYKVSIHTPTKGVTRQTPYKHLLDLFQSTHPRRVWLSGNLTASDSSLFQSTHPRRVWLTVVVLLNPFWLFQSTHPRRVWLSWI